MFYLSKPLNLISKNLDGHHIKIKQFIFRIKIESTFILNNIFLMKIVSIYTHIFC